MEHFVLPKVIESNPLFRIHLKAMKIFGYILFEDQKHLRIHNLRGILLCLSFVMFNFTQVSIIS